MAVVVLCCCTPSWMLLLMLPYEAVSTAVQVLVALAHLTVGRRGAVPPLRRDLLLLWWMGVALWHSLLGAVDAGTVAEAEGQVLVALAHLALRMRSAVPILLRGWLFLWRMQRQRWWCCCTPSCMMLLMLTQQWRRQCTC